MGGYDYEALPSLGLPEIAFLGRSNVGKSSMLNVLAGPGQKPALVSKMPGRTRRINLFRVADSKGDFCAFADLPGYGFAKISKEGQRGIEAFLQQYLAEREELRAVCLLVDSRREPMDSDREILEAFRAMGLPHAVVATKVDKLSTKDREESLERIRDSFDLTPDQPLAFSAADGKKEGIHDVWDVVRQAVLGFDNEDDMEGGEGEGGEGDGWGEGDEGFLGAADAAAAGAVGVAGVGAKAAYQFDEEASFNINDYYGGIDDEDELADEVS